MEILSIANTLNKIHLSSNIFNKFTSAYYYDKDSGFGIFSKQYTENCVNHIHQPYLIQ